MRHPLQDSCGLDTESCLLEGYVSAYDFRLKAVRLQSHVIIPSIKVSLTLTDEVKLGLWDTEQGFRVKIYVMKKDQAPKISAKALLSALEPIMSLQIGALRRKLGRLNL